MTGEINENRATNWLYGKYGKLDPLIEWQDIHVWVQYYNYLHIRDNIQFRPLEYIRRRVLDKLNLEFNLSVIKFVSEQEILKHYSVNHEKYLLVKIDFEAGKLIPKHLCLRWLCKDGHEWLNTGKSLRYKSNNACYKCVSDKEKGEHRNRSVLLDYITTRNGND